MMKQLLETSGVSNMYPADAGEPDTGWINGGNPRVLHSIGENLNRGFISWILNK